METLLTVGVGLTVTVKLFDVPAQPPNEGVTVTVATIGVVLELIVVYPLIFPEPEVPKPTLALLVQLNEAPDEGLEKETPATGIPPQKEALEIVLTVAVGLTTTVKVVLVPVQPPKLGVTVTVADSAEVPAFAAVKAGIFPVPEVPKPTLALLDQVNVAPDVGLEKLMAAPGAPLQ